MEDTIRHGYKEFLTSPAGQDLIKRLISTEAKYQMEGMRAQTIEGKGIAMSKISAIYEIRTMLDDLTKSKPAES